MSEEFTKVKPMGFWPHWAMIFGGLLLGMCASFGDFVAVELRILAWLAGLTMVFYSSSWPATGKLLVKHRQQATTWLVVLVAVSMLYVVREFSGSDQEWADVLDAGINRGAAIAFVVLASYVLGAAVSLRVSALKHAVVLFEGHDVRMLVEEGDPIFARSGFSIEEQENEELQDTDTIKVEIGGTMAAEVDIFTETVIDRENWGPEGQTHWALGEEAAKKGFLKAAAVKMRKVAAEAFKPNDAAGFKRAADGPYLLWIKWLLMTDEDPREDVDLVRKLGWRKMDASGYVPMKYGIEFFTTHAHWLEHELARRASGDSETEKKFGRKFVGEGFGISDTRVPEGVEDAFSEGEEIRELNKELEGIEDERLKLLLAARGKLDVSYRHLDVKGMGDNTVLIEGGGGGAEAIVAARSGKKGKDGPGKPPAKTGHGGSH